MEKNIWKLKAVEVVDALKRGELCPTELVEASINRIEDVDKSVNALPIRCFDRALEHAKILETSKDKGAWKPLFGVPIAVKDYNDVSGVKTTYGSPLFKENIPNQSDATVMMLESRGALPIAKSNVPEWAGGHTYNPVFGVTRNPWNITRSAGGSSGGSAVALATGQVWLATGNDLGGSLRTPAGFNGVVGLRPSPGVVPRGARLPAFDTLWVEGPMGRCVADVALMLDAGAGKIVGDPLSFKPDGASYLSFLETEGIPKRIAFSPNLGIVPVAKDVREVAENAVKMIESQGIEVTDKIPDFNGVLDAFQTLRAVLLGTMMGELIEDHHEKIAPDIIQNVKRGFSITPEELFKAERIRWELSHKMSAFFQSHDFFICPSASIPAFPVEQPFVGEIDGQVCDTYIDWFAITFALTMTSCPVISIPCGFSSEGLPIGLQILGKPRDERSLLKVAYQLEKIFKFAPKLPINPKKP